MMPAPIGHGVDYQGSGPVCAPRFCSSASSGLARRRGHRAEAAGPRITPLPPPRPHPVPLRSHRWASPALARPRGTAQLHFTPSHDR